MAQRTLSEHQSKCLLAEYGVPIAREQLAETPDQAAAAAEALGFPVALKLCGENLAHKTEKGWVRLALGDANTVHSAARELLAARDGALSLLVCEMVAGRRELIAGIARDAQFGVCALLGLGGIFAEALEDVAFAPLPLAPGDASRLLRRLAAHRLFDEPFRGEPALDEKALEAVLQGLSRLALERPDVVSVDVNPLVVRDGLPIAVDALVVLDPDTAPPSARPARPRDDALRERFGALFEPRGVVVAGASTHPGKFGFIALHNLLRFGYAGEVFALHREGAEVLGRQTLRAASELPEGRADLVFACTPPSVNPQLLRDCAAKGVRAAYIVGAGYGETGAEGRALETELVVVADELGLLLAGPNGQGLISTPRSLCAQIVAPYPPAGSISVVSQSGNLASSFLNYATASGIGIARAISCGNAAQADVADYLDYFRVDPETAVALAYLEGISDGAALLESLRAFTASKPLVLVKGGVAQAGQRAATSHTGALASDARIFDGVCAALGVSRAPSVEEAFEWAASFATQPLPRGRRVVVLSTLGGWGVLAADACAAAGLDLIALPDDLRAAIDARVPARWSRNNPIDLAGGETRDTLPELLDLLCAHPQIDAVIYLGIGVQAASAQTLKSGSFYPEHGLERIVEFHERQEQRYASAARESSERHAKPVLIASELVHTDRAYGNAGPLAVKQEGRLCFPSAPRAVRALRALVDYVEFREGLS